MDSWEMKNNSATELRNYLDGIFQIIKNSSLIEVINLVERQILHFLQKDLIKCILNEVVISQKDSKLIGASTFLLNKNKYEVIINEGYQLFEIRIINPNNNSILQREYDIQFDLLGKFQSVRLILEDNLEKYQEILEEHIKFILDTGYKWLIYKVNDVYKNIQDDFSIEIFELVRMILDVELHRHIFLYVTIDDYGFYIYDLKFRENILSRASDRKINTNKSPLELSIIFTTQLTEYKKSFTRQLVELNRSIDAQISNAEYDTYLQIAEHNIFQENEQHFQVLVNKNRYKLTAGYPINEHTRRIETILNREKNRFEAILTRNITKYSKVLNKLKNQDLLINQQSSIPKKIFKYFVNNFTFNFRIYGIGPKTIDDKLQDFLEKNNKK